MVPSYYKYLAAAADLKLRIVMLNESLTYVSDLES